MDEDWTSRSDPVGLPEEILRAAAFLTVLPIGADEGAKPDFRRAARAFPIVGALVGLAGGIVLLLGAALGLPPLAAALIGIGATIALTGALHEDGLADTLDGFGGGRDVPSRLAIMRDSRIGSYGVLGLIGSVGLRVALLAAWLPQSPWQAAMALIAMEAVGRGAVVWLWATLPPARADGLSAGLPGPTEEARNAALVLAAIAGIVGGTLAAGVFAALVALAAAALAVLATGSWARSMIGGQTGDVLGAGEQLTALAFLLALAAFS